MNLDVISKKAQNENVYLNKILKKSLDTETVDSKFPNFKENIPNFHSSIQNIFSNEENREKAMKYVINMRNKRTGHSISPFEPRDSSNSRNIKNKSKNIINTSNNAYSKTIDDDFYDPDKRKKRNKGYLNLKEIPNEEYNYRKNRGDFSTNKKNAIIKPYTGYNIYSNVMQPIFQNNEKIIKVNRINKANNNELQENLIEENLFMKQRINKTRNNSNMTNEFNNFLTNSNQLNSYRDKVNNQK